jgi:hypothetical protein
MSTTGIASAGAAGGVQAAAGRRRRRGIGTLAEQVGGAVGNTGIVLDQ